MTNSWNEEEVRATVRAYFDLLDLQQQRKSTNKSAIYRGLSERFPKRTPKSIELKFQNISAVLYEQKLEYCDGLKPKSNYQNLLKLVVLDEINRTPLPQVEPHEILFSKLQRLKRKGLIPVEGKSSGRYGLALESALGIPPNSSKTPDFMGIELKTKSDNTLQTLFSRTPTRYVQDSNKESMFSRNAYFDDKRNRYALYTSLNAIENSLGFNLKADLAVVKIERKGVNVLEYDAEVIEAALLSKHSQSVFIDVHPVRKNQLYMFEISGAVYCKWPSIIRFMKLVKEGLIYFDLTMSRKSGGRISDHGFLWRIQKSAVENLYLYSENVAWEV